MHTLQHLAVGIGMRLKLEFEPISYCMQKDFRS